MTREAKITGTKAAAAGFRARPVAETAADVLRWRASGPLAAGLAAERESRLIADLGATD